jgi:hypothetical protein
MLLTVSLKEPAFCLTTLEGIYEEPIQKSISTTE